MNKIIVWLKTCRLNLHILGMLAVLVGSLIAFFEIKELAADFPPKERVFLVKERISLNCCCEDPNNLRVWIPYPVSDRWQMISDIKLEGPFDASFINDKLYGNTIAYLKPKQNVLENGRCDILLSFKVRRKENAADDKASVSYKTLSRFLKADRLVPVNGKIKKLAENITRDKNDDLERVRAIYDYIIDELTYSKDDPTVCGIGDSLLTLEHKKGICSDYHSLFISLVRSLGIPAKFEIGFRLPEDAQEGKLNGYHCWAKFYLKGKGWIPVDISEADKHPEKRDYFFGHIDENRVHLTSGRDISLKHSNSSQPLNFFVYPYAELDGMRFNDIDVEITFRELKGG